MAPIVSHMHRCMYRWMDGPKQGRAGAAERSKWAARRDKEGKMGVLPGQRGRPRTEEPSDKTG